jgi:hypothetical protein
MFGYSDLIVDPRNLVWMRDANCPVVADITHSLQQPAGKALEGGGVASGGLRDLIPTVARTCVATGVDGLFMEVSAAGSRPPFLIPYLCGATGAYRGCTVPPPHRKPGRRRWEGTLAERAVSATRCMTTPTRRRWTAPRNGRCATSARCWRSSSLSGRSPRARSPANSTSRPLATRSIKRGSEDKTQEGRRNDRTAGDGRAAVGGGS